MRKSLPKFFIAICAGVFWLSSPALAQLDFPTADPSLDPRQDVVDQAYIEGAEKLTIPALQEKINSLPPDSPERKALEEQLARTQSNVKSTKLDLESRRGRCGVTDIGCWIEVGISWVGQLLIYLGTRLVWVAAKIFEISLEYGVKDLTSLINDGGVTDAWAILRNFANLFFIFVLLYVAIAFILDLKVAQKEKIITTVIISALLINFSAFFAKAVIDISNVTANQFYTAISQRSAGKAHTVTTPEGEGKTGSISGVFLNSLSLEDHYKNPTGSPLKVLVRVFGSTVLLLIVSFVLLAGAVLLIIRAVSLIFLVIVAPLAFLAWAVPSFGDYFIKWWKTLFNQAFFAPLYLLFFFASVKVLESGAMNKLATRADTGVVGGNIALIFHFAIIIGLMLGSLILAVKLGAFGASTVVAYGKKWSRAIPGSFARRTVGKAAYSFRDSKMLKRITAWAPGIGGGLRSIADTGAGAKFGTQKSYKQKIDDATKVGQNEFKGQPELQARYYKSLGRGALARAFGFGDKLIQQRAFEKSKDEEKVKMITGLEKQIDKNQPEEIKKLIDKNKELSEKAQRLKRLIKVNEGRTSGDRSEQVQIEAQREELKKLKMEMGENNKKIKAGASRVKQGQKLSKFVEDMKEKMPKNKKDDLDEELKKKRNKDRIKETIGILEKNLNDIENKTENFGLTTKELLEKDPEYRAITKELESLRKGQEKTPQAGGGESGGGGQDEEGGGKKP